MMNHKPFDVIKAKCPEFYEWLKEISRYSEVEKFVLPDYKNGIRVYLYTHNYVYNIIVKLPTIKDKTCSYCNSTKTKKMDTGNTKERMIFCYNCGKGSESKWGYLGCTVLDRKPVAGEDWQRGRDLADGAYCYKTWKEIKNDIIAFELVKVAKPKEKQITPLVK